MQFFIKLIFRKVWLCLKSAENSKPLLHFTVKSVGLKFELLGLLRNYIQCNFTLSLSSPGSIDEVLAQDDTDDDGYLSYAEFKISREAARIMQTKPTP